MLRSLHFVSFLDLAAPAPAPAPSVCDSVVNHCLPATAAALSALSSHSLLLLLPLVSSITAGATSQ